MSTKILKFFPDLDNAMGFLYQLKGLFTAHLESFYKL